MKRWPAPSPSGLNLAEHPKHRGHGLGNPDRVIQTGPSAPTFGRLVPADGAAGTLGPGTEDGGRLPQPPALDGSHHGLTQADRAVGAREM